MYERDALLSQLAAHAQAQRGNADPVTLSSGDRRTKTLVFEAPCDLGGVNGFSRVISLARSAVPARPAAAVPASFARLDWEKVLSSLRLRLAAVGTGPQAQAFYKQVMLHLNAPVTLYVRALFGELT